MRRYRTWHDINGTPEDPARCVAEVKNHRGAAFHQCKCGRGHGPGGKYCYVHARVLDRGGWVDVPPDE